MDKGKFLVIEGPDGAGSSTQLKLAAEYLKSRDRRVHETKEPTNAMIGGLIRGVLNKTWDIDPYGLQLMYCADRAHHLTTEIQLSLDKGWDVLTDRYLPSTIVYGAAAISKYPGYSNHNEDYWFNLLMKINSHFLVPDLTIILNVDPEVAISRIRASRPNTELFEVKEILRNVSENYKKFVLAYPNSILINANKNPDEIHNEIKDTINSRLVS